MPDDKRSQRVNLGCGSLILIALIVLIFSGRSGDLEQEVHLLRSEVGELKSVVQTQTAEIKLLQLQLEKRQGEAKGK